MAKPSYYIVNGITLYRIVAAPLLLLLVFYHQSNLFKWLLAISFLTDAIDGYIARKYKVISVAGAKLDSIGDDLTVLVAIIGILVFKPEFLRHELVTVIILGSLYILQLVLAMIRYGKPTSFHTWSAKTAAVLQAAFLLLFFFFPDPLYGLFYIMALATVIGLLEEIILVLLLPRWQADIKGVYQIIKKKPIK
jgi:CDP-diacylglycerol--glycerol-3-phosphate 3-phosphatidyltransferase